MEYLTDFKIKECLKVFTEGYGDSYNTDYKELSIESIINIVSNITREPKENILNGTRKREVVRCRHYIVVFSQFVNPCPSSTYLGKELGDRDHATILWAKRKSFGYIQVNDPFFMRYFHQIRKCLGITNFDIKEKMDEALNN